MSRYQSSRRIKIEDAENPPPPRFDDDLCDEILGNDDADRNGQKPSRQRDYLDVLSRPYLLKILEKQGDRNVLFADKVLKFTCSGKMKRRILLITDFALYVVDSDTESLKRRIALAAVEKLCLSELRDNFFVIIIPTEYDLLMASTQKTEIISVLVDATKSASDYELEVSLLNRIME